MLLKLVAFGRRSDQIHVIHVLRDLFEDPATRGLDLDDPTTTDRRRELIQRKGFLRQIYREWYQEIASSLPRGPEPVLEIGSGAGFLGEYIPGLITSELLLCQDVRLVLDARQLPFADRAFRAIVMTNVLHHIPQPQRFFAEAARAIRRDGALVMIEPWVSPWSRFVYARLHHEPFDPATRDWECPPGGPLSSANSALPWILFVRDRARFENEFPEWQAKLVAPTMPFRYLLSGGHSARALMPAATFPFWRAVERTPWMSRWAMFAKIELVRR